GGALAVWWNRPGELTAPVWAAIRAAYVREAPELADVSVLHAPSTTGTPPPEAAPGFEPWTAARFPWTERYSAEAYGELAQTHSHRQQLGPGRPARLVDAIRAAVDEHGGVVDYPYVTRLLLARRTADG